MTVLTMDVKRRHLDTGQRVKVAVELANITVGQFAVNQHVPSANLRTPQISQAEAAALLNVSERSVRTAVALKAESPALFDAMKSESISTNLAAGQRAGLSVLLTVFDAELLKKT